MNCANHPDRERVAFCQNCGKPLCEECKRMDGGSIFCEPCFVARTAPPPPGGFGGAGYVPPGYAGAPRPHGRPEPVLAGLLGLIPGVGAMYNEQYAKGIVHLVVFAVLVSLANDNAIFGLFIAGWIAYMAFDAYHTARSRRDGTPLPNPFGLNDLGDRLGFGRSWPSHTGGSNVPPYTPPAAGGPVQTPPPGAPPMGATYFHEGADGSRTYSTPGAFFHQGPDGSQTYGTAPPAAPWGAPYDVRPVPPVSPVPPMPPAPGSGHFYERIPTGAIWLIGIGCLLLVGHTPVFRIFRGSFFTPMLLIGFGVWVFTRRMMETGHGFENDGTDFYRWRLMRAVNGAFWIILVGILALLNSLRILSWSKSWPVYMIAAGVMMLFRRTMMPGHGPFGQSYAPGPMPSTPPAAGPAPVTSTEIVPVDPARIQLSSDEPGSENGHGEGR